jgi:hypothetical protein
MSNNQFSSFPELDRLEWAVLFDFSAAGFKNG